MAVQITLNQAGAPAGVPGQAREDFATGFAVVATSSGGAYTAYQWELLDVPTDYVAVSHSIAGLSAPGGAATNILPIDLTGTYKLRLSVDSGSGLGATADDVAEITFYAGAALAALSYQLPRRKPAFGEKLEHNVPQAAGLGGVINWRGWAEELDRWFDVIIGLYTDMVTIKAIGTWICEQQLVIVDGQTVFDTVHDVTHIGKTCAHFFVNGLEIPKDEYNVTTVAGHGRVTLVLAGTTPPMVTGWEVEIRYLQV
ncbi:MAG: hypothetical protein WC683_17355 [bacterium]